MKQNKGRSLCLKNKTNVVYVTETTTKQCVADAGVGGMKVLGKCSR
jgi:hypothetical protein